MTRATTNDATDVPAPPGGAAAASDLAARARKSSIATLVGYGSANGLRLASNIVLSHLLAPDAFGTMVLVLTFLQGLQMFSDLGAGPSIVHSRRGDEPAFLDSAFTVQAVRGFVLFAVAFVFAPAFAGFYEEPALATYLRVAAVAAILQGFNSTRIFTAERELAVARKVACDVAAQATAVAVMVAWAAVSPGVWALVFGGLVQPLVVMLLSHTVLPGHRNALRLERAALAELLTFGRWIFLSTLLAFLAMHMDKLLLGRLEELGVLGVYNIAFSLVSMPQILGGTLTGTVLYPVLAEFARRSREALAERFHALRALLLEAARFAMLGMVLGAPPFFRELYGSEYQAATWIAPLLVVPIWFSLLQMTADRACLALGEPRALAASNLAALVAKAGGALLGFRVAGLEGFVLGLAVGTLAGHLVVQRALARHGLPIVRQDVRATVRFAALALPGVALPRVLVALGPLGDATHARSAVEVAVALAVLVPLGLRFVRRTLPALRARPA